MINSERMTWEEICDQYPDQWVIVVDHDGQPHSIAEPKTARVLASGATRAEARARARPALDEHPDWACHFTGLVRVALVGYRPWAAVS